MNIFIIPSWYPSKSNPLNGIFVKEQTLLLAQHYPDINFGISLWGQNDEDYLLHSKRPLSSLRKILRKNKNVDHALLKNVWEFFTPAYSWNQRLNKGNIKGKIEACLKNLKSFERQFGKPDIIHAHVSYPAGYIAQQLSVMTGIPYIITEHMAPFPQKYHLTQKGELMPELRLAIEESHVFVAVSRYLKDEIKKTGVNKPINIIPNFTDPNLFRKGGIKRRDAFTFITASGMLKSKGIAELLEGIELVLKIDKSYRFILVGDGPDLNEFKQKAVELKISDNIIWTGFKSRKDIKEYFLMADAHILCSHYESFGVSYIEAMAMCLPNIAAAIGGPLDIIEENTGVFVTEVTSESIAEKIIWMKENYPLFNPEVIRKSFEGRFSVEAVGPQIRTLYQSLISNV